MEPLHSDRAASSPSFGEVNRTGVGILAGEQVYFDVDHQTSATILERIIQTLGKSEEILGEEALATEKKDNPANFGRNCGRFCMCVIDGQVPCPSLVPLPKHWRGKYHFGHKDINEVEE
eukprot:snap_masked-scaffold275_size226830-processed-gene-0.15 protein:Tk00625 transcript:snap_masked-scaffold275_size226830-processed-gene-0.15-mRNA-1 annotation:"probable mitochondrial 28s ribosomal protein s25"